MFFSRLILLFFIFKIDRFRATKFETLVIDTNAEVKTENYLIEFMSDLKKFSFEKLDHHRLIVFGKNDNFLQSTKVLLESGRPYFISTEAEAVDLPLHFGAAIVVLFFIDGFTDSEINWAFAKLPTDYKCKILMITIEENTSDQSITRMIESAVKMKLKNVSFLRLDGRVIKFYERRMTDNCELKITLTNKWVSKEGFSKTEDLLKRKFALNERGCPMFVSTFELKPTMKLREDENKSFHIIGGLEGHLVLSIAEHLNMVPVVKVPTVKENFSVLPNGTVAGIVGHVAKGVAIFGIGQIRPTLKRKKIVDLTASYSHECMVWTVPLITQYSHGVVISEFSSATWIMVILSVLLCCGLVYTIPKLNLGYKSPLNVIDVIAMTLNYAIPRTPSGILYKLFFLVYLNYSRIISTAYSTSLSSILTTTTPEPAIVNDLEILTAGLRTAGTQSSLVLIRDILTPNGPRAEIINRYEVITSVEAALARISDRQDIAYLRQYSTIVHAAKEREISGKPVKFYPLSRCVISYNTVMVTPKGSHLTDIVSDIIVRLREAGIYRYWLSLDRAFNFQTIKLDSHNRSLSRLESIFFLYLCCLFPAFLAFGTELIACKLKFNQFTR